MAKQDKSKFQLNKGTDHGFDISKGGKRKFDLTKDVDDGDKTSETVSQFANSSVTDQFTSKPPQKNRKWLWIIPAIIAAGIIVWIIFGNTSMTKQIVEAENDEQVAVPTDEGTEGISEGTSLPTDEAETDETGESNESGESSETEGNPITSSISANPVDSNTVPEQSSNPTSGTSIISNDIEAEAMKVIRGEYGVGQERKNRLGNQYEVIQNRVNELKREGVF